MLNNLLLKSYLLAHLRNCIACLGALWRERWNSTVTILIIGIALALPTGLTVLLANIQQLNTSWRNGIQITVTLKPTVTNSILTSKKQFFAQPGIVAVKYISPQQALQEFEQATNQRNLLTYLGSNPLPAILTIQLRTDLTTTGLESLLQQLERWPEVTELQLDKVWLQRLQAILAIAKYGVTIIATVLACGVFLISSNTIRLNIEKCHKQIVITKLVGATNAFIRREFLYLGFWYGFFGSIITWLIVTISLNFLSLPIAKLAALYQSNFQLVGINLVDFGWLSLLSITICIGSAIVAVGQYLDKLEYV